MATKTSAITSSDSVISHWYTLIENLQASPLAFYQSVEGALQRRQIPDTQNSRVDYKESGLLSARREYLHVTREKLVFDICGAPFGTGFFVSSWLVEKRPSLAVIFKVVALVAMLALVSASVSNYGLMNGLLLIVITVPAILYVANGIVTQNELSDDFIRVLPLIGPLYEWLFKPGTYYRIDTMLMFQQAVHNAVLEAVDELTTAKGLRALSEGDRKPIMREFVQRKAA